MAQGQSYRDTIRRVRGLVDAQGGSALALGITESNVTWDGTPEKSTLAASPGTFYAGLWTAEAIGIALEERVFPLALWSLSEGWTLGFYERGTGRTRPAAHVYQLCTSHFGSTVLHAKTVPEGRSVYASRNTTAGRTTVMIINRSPSAAREVVAFEDLSVSLVKRAVRSPEYALTLVEFPDGGSPQVWRYTQALADRDQPPELQSLE